MSRCLVVGCVCSEQQVQHRSQQLDHDGQRQPAEHRDADDPTVQRLHPITQLIHPQHGTGR